MKSARHERINAFLDDHGHASVAELGQRLGVSEMTIRRDLAELERAGLLRRVHGGATQSMGRAYEPPFRFRAGAETEHKDAIAAAAVSMIADGDAIALDVGSTVLRMVRGLTSVTRLTVVTASLRAATEIAALHALEQSVRLILAGGVVRAEELSMTGQAAVDSYRRIQVDRAFVGVGGIDARAGASEFNLEDADVKQQMVASARQVVVLADATKLGQTCFAAFADVTDVDVLVTDDRAEPEALRQFEKAGVEVVVARAVPPRTGSGS